VELIREYNEQTRTAVKPASVFGRLAAVMKEDDPTTQKLKIALVEDLNKLLSDESLSEHLGGAGRGPAKGEAMAGLNRSLLNDLFAGSLAPVRRLEATQLNPSHAEIIATSPKAQDMAVNMFSGFWSLLLTIGTVIMVSLFTTPKPDAALKNLVYGMTPLPDEGPCPWYRKPVFWAGVVVVVLVAVNIIFW